MYTPTLLTLLLSTTALAIPNPLNLLHPAPHSPDAAATYSDAGYNPAPQSTVTVTSFTTVYTPAASATSTADVAPSSSFSTTLTLEETSTSTTTVLATISPNTTVASSVTSETSGASATSETSVPTSTPGVLAGVYICVDINWGGDCTHHSAPVGSAPSACTTLNGTASSVGPDKGFSCNFYSNSYCDALFTDGRDIITLAYPGAPDLRSTDKGDWNDRVYSFQCFEQGEE